MSEAKRNGLVLSGGGARGAYEVGVLQYIREKLPARLGKHLHFNFITGTSVGALNGAFLAATADDLDRQASRLADAWRGLHLEELISLKAMDLFRAGRLLMGKDPGPPKPGTYRYGGILDTRGLEQFVFRIVPWRGIRANLKRGLLDGLAVTATHVGTGHSVVFVDTPDPLPQWSHNPLTRAVPAAISPRHALASAAIPLLFPAVKVGRAFYVDGGLRANTPMSPAIRLGADRLLIISLRYQANKEEEMRKSVVHEADYPKPLFLLGKALNSLMLDPTSYDLQRMRRINDILDSGTKEYGAGFPRVISSKNRQDNPLRKMQAVHIHPSEDIGSMAAALLARGGPRVTSRVARSLLRRLAENEATSEADMLSYLLFDGEFAGELIELGYEDARAHEDKLLEVFGQD